jgi:hypothetical protein
MSTQDQDLSAIFGEPARHSEYTIGQVVRYASDGRIQTGEVSWTTPADATHPLEYWVNGLTCCTLRIFLAWSKKMMSPTQRSWYIVPIAARPTHQRRYNTLNRDTESGNKLCQLIKNGSPHLNRV